MRTTTSPSCSPPRGRRQRRPRDGARLPRSAPAAPARGSEALARTPAAGLDAAERFGEVLLRFNRAGAVFVAAINGSAMGGGCELALACDAADGGGGAALIGQPEILFGFPPGGGGTQRLARMLGSARTAALPRGGATEPDDAHELGLIDEVVGREQLMDRARAVAERLARRPKGGIAGVKRAVPRLPVAVRRPARGARGVPRRDRQRGPGARPWPPTSRASSAPARCPVTIARRSSARTGSLR